LEERLEWGETVGEISNDIDELSCPDPGWILCLS
jgi:hypothetical protein